MDQFDENFKQINEEVQRMHFPGERTLENISMDGGIFRTLEDENSPSMERIEELISDAISNLNKNIQQEIQWRLQNMETANRKAHKDLELLIDDSCKELAQAIGQSQLHLTPANYNQELDKIVDSLRQALDKEAEAREELREAVDQKFKKRQQSFEQFKSQLHTSWEQMKDDRTREEDIRLNELSSALQNLSHEIDGRIRLNIDQAIAQGQKVWEDRNRESYNQLKQEMDKAITSIKSSYASLVDELKSKSKNPEVKVDIHKPELESIKYDLVT